MPISWGSASSITVRTGIAVYSNRHAIQKYWTKAKAYLDKGSAHIVITGLGGVGKTILASQMHGRARDLNYELPPESQVVEVEAITAGHWTKLVRIIPGQGLKRTKGEIANLRDNEGLEGVIHVVDFGYKMPRSDAGRATLLTVDQVDTVEKLRQRNLEDELSELQGMLRTLKQLYVDKTRPKWLIIAVNKVDLFPDQRAAALSYYHPNGDGKFGLALKGFISEIGSENMPVYVLQACAYQDDFSWNGEVIPTSLKPKDQNVILREFMEAVAVISEVHE